MSNPINDWFASAFAPATTTPAPSAPVTVPDASPSGSTTVPAAFPAVSTTVPEASASAPTPAVNGSSQDCPTAHPTPDLTLGIISVLESYIETTTVTDHIASPNYSPYSAAIRNIHTLDTAYWSADPHPIVDDPTYDRLMALIEQFEAKYHYRATDSPTKNPATTPSNGRKSVRRATPMLSTYKVHDTDAVIKWIKTAYKTLGPVDNADIAIEWKMDGVSVSLVYIDGVLTEASEGKGDYGNDVLQHCLAIPSIPKTLTVQNYKIDGLELKFDKYPHRFEVRGEIVCRKSNLEKAVAFGYDKNCRSTASGIMANRTPDPKACALLDFVPWYADHFYIGGQTSIYSGLFSAGFTNSRMITIGEPQISATTLFREDDGELTNALDEPVINVVNESIEYHTRLRNNLDFPTDGIIFKVNNLDYWQRFKNTDKKHKYLLAYKFPAQTAETTLRAIDHTVGFTGKVTPVGYFDPVVINGATYSKASIGSDRILAEMNIHPGDRIIVSLRNDVIPHIDGRAD